MNLIEKEDYGAWWVLESVRNEVEKIKLARQGHKILKLIIFLMTRDIRITFFYASPHQRLFFFLSDPMTIKSGIIFFFLKC